MLRSLQLKERKEMIDRRREIQREEERDTVRGEEIQ